MTKVLSQDEGTICKVWMRNVQQDMGQTVLKMVRHPHLQSIFRLC